MSALTFDRLTTKWYHQLHFHNVCL